jgi:nicotinate-nucleotide pyrophosphorylase (carboxylating)
VNNIVKKAMSEDLYPSGDITTRLIKNNNKIKVKIIYKENCIIG